MRALTKAQLQEAKNMTPEQFIDSLNPVQEMVARSMVDSAISYGEQRAAQFDKRMHEHTWRQGTWSGVSIGVALAGLWFFKMPTTSLWFGVAGLVSLAAQGIYLHAVARRAAKQLDQAAASLAAIQEPQSDV